MKWILILLLSMPMTFLVAQDAKELTDKAKSLADRGNHEEALKVYSAAISADASYLDAYIKRAFSYNILKQYDAAIADYSSIIELRPEFIYAYLGRGTAYNKLSKYKEALNDFNTAIGLDKENQEAYNNRGWAKKGLGDNDGACADWKKSKKMGNSEAKIILKNNNC